MNFTQTGFLIGAAAIAIPVVVHLLSRWQIRRMELGTMRFLQEVIHDTARRRRLRRWFLLLTRALVMLLLAMLFARPYLTTAMSRDGTNLRIVLIDRSSSMGMPGQDGRLLDDAVFASIDHLSGLGSNVRVLWAWFDRHVEPLPDETSRPTPPRVAVGETDYAAALKWARDRLNAYPQSDAEVLLVTDLQQSGFRLAEINRESLAFPRDVPVRIIDVGRTAANNLAITHAAPAATQVKSMEDVRVNVTLFNYGSLPFEEVPASATAYNGTRTVRLKKSVQIPKGEAEETSFNFGRLEPGVWQITIAVDVDDDLAVDNRRFTAVEVVEPIPTFVLDSKSADSGRSSESYFLVAALSQSDHPEPERADPLIEEPRVGRFRVETVSLDDGPSRIISAHDSPLVVVANAGAIPATMIQQLENYVRSGGGLLVFAGEGASVTNPFWNDSGLAPGQLESPRSSGVMPFRIVSIDSRAPMMKPFADPQHADMSRLAFRTVLPVIPHKQTEVLARFDQDRPAVTLHRLGEGKVVWFLSSSDSSWGHWTTSPLYLPIVQQMASEILNLTGEGRIRFRTIGDDDMAVTERSRAASNGEAEPTETSRRTFSYPGIELRGETVYVVNGSAAESDPARMDASAFVDHFGLSIPDESGQQAAKNIVVEKRNELWPWLAAVLCVLVAAEFFLANRTTA